jgi:hypothetical protein
MAHAWHMDKRKGGRTDVAEEKLPEYLSRLGHVFDPAPFAQDLYRLVCLVLADKPVAKLGPDYFHLHQIKVGFVRAEVTRILISIAVALRIRFDQQDPKTLHELNRTDCGKLYETWPGRKNKVLTLREACNKIIHAKQIRFDSVVPDEAPNPFVAGAYISRPYL